jgi:hypothetical protein
MLVTGWVVTAASFAGGIVTVLALMVESNGSPPPIEYGVVLACASPVSAVIGLTLLTANRAAHQEATIGMPA